MLYYLPGREDSSARVKGGATDFQIENFHSFGTISTSSISSEHHVFQWDSQADLSSNPHSADVGCAI